MLNDHIHILIEILPKYSVAQVIGYIKGKSALYRARRYGERQRYFTGQHMWARGYFVSTVGLDEEVIRKYIREQEKNDLRQGKSTFLHRLIIVSSFFMHRYSQSLHLCYRATVLPCPSKNSVYLLGIIFSTFTLQPRKIINIDSERYIFFIGFRYLK